MPGLASSRTLIADTNRFRQASSRAVDRHSDLRTAGRTTAGATPVVAERVVVMSCDGCTRPIIVRVPLADLTDEGAPVFDPTPASTALWLHRRFCTGA